MGKKTQLTIGLLITNDDIGVIYYLRSIIKTLHNLPVSHKPVIILFYTKNCQKHIQLFDYKPLRVTLIKPPPFVVQYIKFIITGRNFFLDKLARVYGLNGFFPLNDIPASGDDKYRSVSWIPDFQHKFYPQLFTRKNIILREKRFQTIIQNTDALVLSSNDAYQHLQTYYSIPTRLKVHVLPFVSLIKDYQLFPLAELKNKYQIHSPYFLVSNQFYEHKNHLIVFKAIKLLKERGFNPLVIFTGKLEDYRNPKFYPELVQTAYDWQIADHIKILGLIPREEQLSLMNGAIAIIQPSKFEGWSTSIEDAKTLNTQVICSNLPVHVEQMEEKAFYFHPDDDGALSNIMLVVGNGSIKPTFQNYDERVKVFAEGFMSIFNNR